MRDPLTCHPAVLLHWAVGRVFHWLTGESPDAGSVPPYCARAPMIVLNKKLWPVFLQSQYGLCVLPPLLYTHSLPFLLWSTIVKLWNHVSDIILTHVIVAVISTSIFMYKKELLMNTDSVITGPVNMCWTCHYRQDRRCTSLLEPVGAVTVMKLVIGIAYLTKMFWYNVVM